MAESALITAYTTVASREDALLLAHAAVEARLAACAQLTAIESVYTWNGVVQQDAEVRVMFKTTHEHCDTLKARILELHPYELPAFYVLHVSDADQAYAAWVRDSIR